LACLVTVGLCEQPQKVSVCDLKNDPAVYNHKLIEVEGFVSHDFEDFSLFDPNCPYGPQVWLEYGGTAASGTMYCCGVTADRSRPNELVVENIPIPLLQDTHFQQFDRLIQPPFRSGNHGSTVNATLVGRFFAGEKREYPNGGWGWGGYGHFGCCSLLAIQEVHSVDPQDRDDLDYGASPDQPDLGGNGCSTYQNLIGISSSKELLEAQQHADLGEEPWIFQDPQRVASNALARLLKVKDGSITGIKETRKAEGRLVYQWRQKGTAVWYMLVLSRPYWLSFYARDPKKVAWVVIAAYKICE